MYSGETCLHERVLINTTYTTIGKYCGRRIMWSVFVSSALSSVAFHTFNYSTSYFILQYQLTNDKVSTSMLTNKTLNDLKVTFKSSFVFHKYVLANVIYYNWNLFVSKMFKISIILMKVNPDDRGGIYLYDGPDFHASQYDATNLKTFTSSSFQVSILFHGYFSDIIIKFKRYIFKKAVQNFKTFLVKNNSEWISSKLKCLECLYSFVHFIFMFPEVFMLM